MITDTPTERTRFQETTLLDQEAFLEGIRERRLKALQVYQELQAEKQLARDRNLLVKAGKILVRMETKAAMIDKQMADYEKMVKDARGILVLIGGAQ